MRPELYAHGSGYHQQRRWTHQHSLRCLQTAIEVMGKPASLLDVGCAEGVHVTWAQAQGIDAMGIDLAAPLGDPTLVCADLRDPVDLGRQFQWVLCWEVAEHLPAWAAETLCDTIVRHVVPGGRVLFTAARPGQRGPGHLHCVEPAFWHRLFAERGLRETAWLSAELRRHWLQRAPRTPWYGRNVSVYGQVV